MFKSISRACLVCLIPAFAFSPTAMAEGRTEALYNPPPIEVPAGKTQEEVLCVVRTALLALGWQPVMKSPNQMEATLRLRRHVAVTNVRFDTKAITINYVDGEELDYRVDDGRPYIHRAYNGWVSNAERAIRASLQ